MKKILFVLIIEFLVINAFSQGKVKSKGETLFSENKPEEAVLFLEEEIQNQTASADAYNYLGLAYFQLGDYEKSVAAFAKGLGVSGTNKKLLAYNQGNSYFAMKKYLDASKSYSLALSADSSYSDALLNRANAYTMEKLYDKAIDDYKKFLILKPEDKQKDSIIALIDALSKEIIRLEEEEKLQQAEAERIALEEALIEEALEKQRQEEERIAEEKRVEEARIAEEKRIKEEKEAEERRLVEEEQRRIEQERLAKEAERRRKLLEDVANSLHNTGSTNMSSGAEDIMDSEQESDLD